MNFKSESKYIRLVSPTNGSSKIKLLKNNFVTFQLFSLNLNLFSSFATGKAQINRALVYCYLMYCFIFVLSHSRTTTYLSGTNQKYELPVFLIILISRFFIRVQAFSRTNSNINGFVECDLSFAELFSELADISFDDYLCIIEGTPFSRLNSTHDYKQFRTELQSFIQFHIFEGFALGELNDDGLETEFATEYSDAEMPPLEVVLHNVLLSFPYFKAMFYRPDSALSYGIGDFSNSISRNIGIHRFRRAYFPGCYASNAFSLAAIKGATLYDMVCFLCVYQPYFYEGVADSLSESDYVIPGDSTLDVSSITPAEYLLMLFSYTQHKPNQDQDNGGQGSANAGGPNHGNRDNNHNYNPKGDSHSANNRSKRQKSKDLKAKKLADRMAKNLKGANDAVDTNGAGKNFSTFSRATSQHNTKLVTNSFEFGGKSFVYTNPQYSQLKYGTKLHGILRLNV